MIRVVVPHEARIGLLSGGPVNILASKASAAALSMVASCAWPRAVDPASMTASTVMQGCLIISLFPFAEPSPRCADARSAEAFSARSAESGLSCDVLAIRHLVAGDQGHVQQVVFAAKLVQKLLGATK
jgi:hypothetical protein